MTRYSSKSWRTFRPRIAPAQAAPTSIRLVARDCRVLGLDPGSQRTGYGVIDSDGARHTMVAAGVICTSPKSSFEARLLEIAGGQAD